MPVDLTDDTTAIRERLAAATPGPWKWRIYPKHNTVELTTDNDRGRLNVMDFARWGMQSATPRFIRDRFWMQPLPQVPDHPDANLIAHAPTDIAFLLARVEQLETELAARSGTGKTEWRWVEPDGRHSQTLESRPDWVSKHPDYRIESRSVYVTDWASVVLASTGQETE